MRVSGISRDRRPGSFVLAIEAVLKSGEKQLIGVEPIFSRWHVPSCGNCQNSLAVTVHKPLPVLGVGETYTGMTPKLKVLENTVQVSGEKEKTVSDITSDSALDPGPFIEVGGDAGDGIIDIVVG